MIKQTSDDLVLLNTTTDASGNVSTTFTHTSDVAVTIIARKSTLPIPRFEADDASNTIKVTGMNQNFELVLDTTAVQA